MKPTKREQLLIDGLKLCGVSKGMGAVIFLTLKTEENMLEMCDYLADHRDATEQELLNKAREIAGTGEMLEGES